MDTISDIYFRLLGQVLDKPFFFLLTILPNYFESLYADFVFSFPLNCTDIIEMEISWGKEKKKCSNLKMLLKTLALSPPPFPIIGQYTALKRIETVREYGVSVILKKMHVRLTLSHQFPLQVWKSANAAIAQSTVFRQTSLLFVWSPHLSQCARPVCMLYHHSSYEHVIFNIFFFILQRNRK